MENQHANHLLTAELFDKVWENGTYQGFGHGTLGEMSTPFLEPFIQKLKTISPNNHAAVKVSELGAGSCGHSFRMALEGFNVTAVEFSASAVEKAKARLADMKQLANNLRIECLDLTDFVRQLPENSLHGLYANSVFHFFTHELRMDLYRLLHKAQVKDGLLAISFKAVGDSLQKRGKVISEKEAGPIVEGEDGIRRLFVSENVEPMVREMEQCGYQKLDVVRWTVPHYNFVNENSEFVGIIAKKVG